METLKLELVDGKYKLSKNGRQTFATSERVFGSSKVFGRRHYFQTARTGYDPQEFDELARAGIEAGCGSIVKSGPL